MRVPAGVNDHPVLYITIDTASDVPRIAAILLGQHPTLKNTKKSAVPPDEINLRISDGSQPEILGHTWYPFDDYARRYYSNSGRTHFA